MSDSNDHNSFPAVAVVLIIATGIALAGMDALAKFLALQVPIIMVLWGRYFFHTVITFSAYGIKTRSLQFLLSRTPALHFISASSLSGATLLIYNAIPRTPFGTVSAIPSLRPVPFIAISGFFLGSYLRQPLCASVDCVSIGAS